MFGFDKLFKTLIHEQFNFPLSKDLEELDNTPIDKVRKVRPPKNFADIIERLNNFEGLKYYKKFARLVYRLYTDEGYLKNPISHSDATKVSHDIINITGFEFVSYANRVLTLRMMTSNMNEVYTLIFKDIAPNATYEDVANKFIKKFLKTRDLRNPPIAMSDDDLDATHAPLKGQELIFECMSESISRRVIPNDDPCSGPAADDLEYEYRRKQREREAAEVTKKEDGGKTKTEKMKEEAQKRYPGQELESITDPCSGDILGFRPKKRSSDDCSGGSSDVNDGRDKDYWEDPRDIYRTKIKKAGRSEHQKCMYIDFIKYNADIWAGRKNLLDAANKWIIDQLN